MIQLYSYFRSSCSWRVRLALNVLEIPYRTIPINLLKNQQKSETYLGINPLGTVPAIRTGDGAVVWQSLAIIDLLDVDQRLLPTDRYERARCIQIVQTICSEIQPLQNLSVVTRLKQLAGDQAGTDWALHHNQTKLQIINDSLVDKSGGFCIGRKVTLADICLIPQLYSANRFGIDLKTSFPHLYRIAKSLETIDAFKRAHAHSQPDCPDDVKALGVFFK
jgi:maleylacetoacetate isomerase